MWVFVVIGYLLLVGLAAWFGGGAVMTVAAGGFVLAVALWLLDGLLADLLRGPLRWLAKPFRALASALGVLIVLPFIPGIFLGSFLLELFRRRPRQAEPGRPAPATPMQAAGRRTAALDSQMWHKISGPMSAVLMPLLGAVAAFGLARSGQLLIRSVIGMGLGFTYFVFDNAALAMGDFGGYSPMVAAWAPFVLFALVGETVLIRTEE